MTGPRRRHIWYSDAAAIAALWTYVSNKDKQVYYIFVIYLYNLTTHTNANNDKYDIKYY